MILIDRFSSFLCSKMNNFLSGNKRRYSLTSKIVYLRILNPSKILRLLPNLVKRSSFPLLELVNSIIFKSIRDSEGTVFLVVPGIVDAKCSLFPKWKDGISGILSWP